MYLFSFCALLTARRGTRKGRGAVGVSMTDPYNSRMATGDFASLAGELLLALPGIGDPRFEQAVIAMCVHEPDGAIGIGHRPDRAAARAARPAQAARDRARRRARRADPSRRPGRAAARLRAPFARLERRGHVDRVGRVSLTTTLDVLRAIAEGEGPDRWLVALGYAGWGEEQLDEEMRRHGWLWLARARNCCSKRRSRIAGRARSQLPGWMYGCLRPPAGTPEPIS